MCREHESLEALERAARELAQACAPLCPDLIANPATAYCLPESPDAAALNDLIAKLDALAPDYQHPVRRGLTLIEEGLLRANRRRAAK